MIKFLEKNKNLTRKERERLLKRFEILDAAASLFAEKGYDKTKLEDIAEIAEFGKGTIYNYFENKENIYVEIIDRITDDYLVELKKIDSTTKTLKEFISLLIDSIIEFVNNDKAAFLMLLRMRTERNAIEKVRKSKVIKNYKVEASKIFELKINQAIKNKEIKKINPEHFLILFRSSVFPYFHSMLMMNRISKKDLREAGNFIVTTLFNGISKR
ncbi:MAG: TetR/AcrR family transcriptional regulator [Ignavibacteriae bacterium]|nr:TetR/AcrR family transcriptional regulator [Ignavibacteriota bacterium]